MGTGKGKNTETIIREYLTVNNFKPGDRIPTQVELIKTLGLSSRALREGITILINQGVLVTKGKAGTFVTNPKELSVVEPIKWYFEANDVPEIDLITARATLESSIIREACRKRTTKDLLLLQQWIDAQSEKDISAEREIECDKKFHLQLMSCAHNKVFEIVANVILLQFGVIYKRGLYPDQDTIRIQDHQEILDAVFQRNEDLASELAQKHILRSQELSIKQQ